jgi:hypothetical protein
MSRLENDPKSNDSRAEQQGTPQPQPTAYRAQYKETPPRRPQNFDDWRSTPRDDDPTR